VVLNGSIGLPRPKSLTRRLLAPSALGRWRYRSNYELFRYTLGERDTDPDRDDHPIVREGLIAVLALEDDLKVVRHAHDGDRQLVGSVTFGFTEDQESVRKSSK